MSPIGFLLKFSIKRWNNDVVGHLVFFIIFSRFFRKLCLPPIEILKLWKKHLQKMTKFIIFWRKNVLTKYFIGNLLIERKKQKNPSYRILIKSQFCVFHHFPIIPKSTKNHVFKKVRFLIRTLHLFRLLSHQNDLISRWATQKMILVKLKMLLEFSCSIENSFFTINFLTP